MVKQKKTLKLRQKSGVVGNQSPPGVLPPYIDKKPGVSFLTGLEFPEKHNVAWRIELAQEDSANPLLEPKYPWDAASIFSHGSVMIDPIDGLWKMWYITTPKKSPLPISPAAGRVLNYAESEDGVHWNRPELDISLYQGRTKTNVLLDLDSGGVSQHASILVHPDAPPDWRYEMFVLRYPGHEGSSPIVKGFPLDPGETKHSEGMYRYHSKDGKHWSAWEKLVIDTRDSLWISQLPDGTYQTYHKTCMPALPGGLIPYDCAVGECRIMVRRTSATGTEWSPYQLSITPDWLDSPDTQFMELIADPERDGYVGLLTVYHALSQTIDVQFAASRDGKTWWRPDRRACIPLKPLGEYGGGMIWPMQPAIHHGGRVYLYYSACDGLHNDHLNTEIVERARQGGLPGWPHYWTGIHMGEDAHTPIAGYTWFHGVMCRASWSEGRLWAAVTASGGPLEGQLATKVQRVGGKRLEVNAVTLGDGTLEVELLKDDQPIPGFTRADCTPFRGDEKSAQIRWRGGERCPAEQVRTRFYLKRARFYGFEWIS